MEATFARFAAREGRELNGLRFVCNGIRWNPGGVIGDYEYESDDIVDALLEVVGGTGDKIEWQ